MTDVFVGYARVDRERVDVIVGHLRAEGWTVWYDDAIKVGETFRTTITQQIRAAKVAIVVWSQPSATSEWVIDEAEMAKALGKLVPLRIDDAPLPLGFGGVHTHSLAGWDGTASAASFQTLVRMIRKRLEDPAAPEVPPTVPGLDQLFDRARASQERGDWSAAATAYAQILHTDPTYLDARARLQLCEKNQQVIELQDELRSHAASQRWQAVIDADEQLRGLDPDATDPDGLTTKAQAALVQERSTEQLNRLYGDALAAEDFGDWPAAATTYTLILRTDPTYLDARARLQLCEKNQQVIELQDELRSHAASQRWQAVIDADEQLRGLDPDATDPDGLATKAHQALTRRRSRTLSAAVPIAIITVVAIVWTSADSSPPAPNGSSSATATSTPPVDLYAALPKSPTPIPDDDLIVARQVDGVAALYQVNSITGETGQQLTPAGAEKPVLSPDRRSIIYLIRGADEISSSIRVVAADGNGDRDLFPRVPGCQRYLTPTWNPANPDQIAMACVQEKVGFSMLIVGLDGNIVHDFENKEHWVDDLSFSPDGQTLAYMSGDPTVSGSAGRIVTVPADGNAQPVALTDEFTDRGPSWSPNGDRIAFDREVPSDPSRHTIFVMSVNGSDQVPVGVSTGDDTSPSWSVDGDKIAFVSNRDRDDRSQYRYFLMDSDGANIRRLNPNDSSMAFSTPAWGPRATK